MKQRVKKGLSSIADNNLLQKADEVLKAITGNLNLPNLPVEIKTLSDQIMIQTF